MIVHMRCAVEDTRTARDCVWDHDCGNKAPFAQLYLLFFFFFFSPPFGVKGVGVGVDPQVQGWG